VALILKSALFRVRLREAALEKFGRKPDNDSDDGTPKSWTVVDFGEFCFHLKSPRQSLFVLQASSSIFSPSVLKIGHPYLYDVLQLLSGYCANPGVVFALAVS
jgi:hypothetical protein